MKKLALVGATLFMTVSSLSFAASLQSMGKQEAMQILPDKTLTTISMTTVDGTMTNNPATMYFSKQNQVMGQFAQALSNNQPQNDQGKWEVKADGSLCVTWQTWNQKNPICVFIYKVKNGLVFVNVDSGKLETVVLKDNIVSGNQMSQSMGTMNSNGTIPTQGTMPPGSSTTPQQY